MNECSAESRVLFYPTERLNSTFSHEATKSNDHEIGLSMNWIMLPIKITPVEASLSTQVALRVYLATKTTVINKQ